MSYPPVMPSIDLRDNDRIPQIVELLEVMSRIKDPVEMQREYATRIRKLQSSAGYVALSVRDLPPGFFRVTRSTLDSQPAPDWRDNWKLGHTLPLYRGGFLGDVISTPEPKLFHHLFISDDPVLGDALAPMGSAMAIPLFDAGKVQNWGIVFRHDKEGFNQAELEDQLMRGNLIGGMVRNLVNVRRIEDLNTQLEQQMQQVAAIQRSLIPQRLPAVDGLSLAASYVTSNQAGGDYYDFFDMGKGTWGVVVADVSGHGAGAATVMAMLQTILHDYQERDAGPAAMLRHANRQLIKKNLDGSFVTAFAGVFDPDRRGFTFSSAGHPGPAVRGALGGVREITGQGGLPLGVIDDADYALDRTEVKPGETMVIYTDGITEAFSPPPEKQMFGVERLKRSLSEGPGEPAGAIDAIHGQLFEFTQSLNRTDDQTIVAVRVDT